MKKIINVLMVFIVLLNLMPITVFAENNNLKTYEQNGYTINYEIVNSWENSQNITVTIKNTGTETIDNWMLEYDFNGDVVGIWNAVTAIDNNGSEYIKNAGHNAVIEPESSAVFGYTLENAKGFPNSIVMCQKESIKESGYNVELRVIDEWDDNFNGEIIITNTADDPIECWTLNFDSNFTIVEITDSWAASILSAAEGSYTLKGTYTNIIYGNSSAAIGFTGKKSGTPEIIDYKLTEVIKTDSTDNNPDLEDIGQIYFKDIQSEDDVEYDGNGIYYVRGQVLLTAKDNVSFNDIEILAETLNAEIVGYIELTNDYQIEFNSEMTTEELYQIIDELNTNQIVEYSSLNTVVEADEAYMPQDYNDNNYKKVKWGINAIKADKAWEYFDESKDENKNRNIVKIGLIDNYFEKHYDLDYKFIWNNPDAPQSENPQHGNHVAGIMAAKFDNVTKSNVTGDVKNIAGICPKNELYAVAVQGIASAFEYKYALALLIGNNVRVINISQHSGEECCFGASNNNKKAQNHIKTTAEIIEKFLQKLIDKNYDFLIVTAAGNTNRNDIAFIKNDNSLYGYEISANGTLSGNAEALYSLFFNYISGDVEKRIICVGSIGHKYVKNNIEYYFDEETCIGSRVDVLAPGVNIYSTILDNSYNNMTGTSMAAPHVAGIAGMMYSIDPSLTAEDVKNYIISTATQEISTPDNSYTYNLVDAEAAVDKVSGSGGYEEKTNGIVLGKVIEKDQEQEQEKNLEYVTVTVYENIDGEIKKSEDIKEEKTSAEGEYEFVLPVGDYVLEYTKGGYVTHRENVTVTENFVKKIDDILLVKGVSVSVKDKQTKAFLSDVKITFKSKTDDSFTEDTTNEIGEFVCTCRSDDYIITLSRDGYEDKTLEVKASFGLLYDRDGNKINEILLDPVKIILCGNVKKYDKSKNLLEPYSGFNVSIYTKPKLEDADGKESENISAIGAITDSNGKYEISLDTFGDYIVVFTEEKQHEITISSNGTYIVNEVIEFNIDNDDDDNNENDNSGSGSDSWNDIGDAGLTFDFDGDGGTSFTGDGFTGDLFSGIWLKTSNGTDNYYVRIYTTNDVGEYTGSIGAQGCGIYTTTYHHWVHELKMATYKTDGTLINEQTLDYFYEKVYVYLPEGYRQFGSTETTPLMKIEAIISASLRNDSISYIIHTDGYYKETVNCIGFIGICKEDWEKDETKKVTFYNNSKCTGVSYKSPFDESEK